MFAIRRRTFGFLSSNSHHPYPLSSFPPLPSHPRHLATMAPSIDTPAPVPLAAQLGVQALSLQGKESAAKQSKVLHRHLGHVPLRATRAEGVYLYGPGDAGAGSEKRYLDACGGAAVVSIGHGDERVVGPLIEQMRTVNYCHSGNWSTDPSEELAELLCASAPPEADFTRVYFANGGSEAVESALKLARQHFVEKGEPQRVNFVAREQSFHGNLLGGLAVGGHAARRAHFEPLLSSNFHKVSPCYAYRHQREGESTEQYVQRLADELEAKFVELGPDTVCAFVAEPVVGATTGCVPSVEGYFKAVRAVCDKYGALLILDEVMSGMGRTGKLWAFEHEGITPDIVTVAKGLSGGYAPLSAVVANSRVVGPLEKGTQVFVSGFTFQAWSVGARAGLEVQKVVAQDGLVAQCAARGAFLESELRKHLGDHPNVGDIRGRGLFLGVEFVKDRKTKEPFESKHGLAGKVVDAGINRGVVLYAGTGTKDGKVGDHVLAAPPYIITEAQCSEIAVTLREALDEVLAQIAKA